MDLFRVNAKEIDVTSEMDELYAIYTRDPVIQMCKTLIHNRLFSEGINISFNGYASHDKGLISGKSPLEVVETNDDNALQKNYSARSKLLNKNNHKTKNASVVEATPTFRKIVDKYYSKFASAILDNFFLFGFCAWKKITVKERDELRGNKLRKFEVPFCLKYGTYRAMVTQDSESMQPVVKIMTQKSGMWEHDPSIKILTVNSDFIDLKNGNLITKVSSLIQDNVFINKLLEYSLVAEHVRSHPTVYTQAQKDKNSSMSDIVANESYTDPDMLRDREISNHKRTKMQMNSLFRQKEFSDMLNHNYYGGIGVGGLSNNTSSNKHSQMYYNKSQQWKDALFHLPEGIQLASSPQLPQSRSDLLPFIENRTKRVCAVFGIPRNLIIPDGGGSNGSKMGGGSNIRDSQMLRDNITAYQGMVENALIDVYIEMYGDQDDVIIDIPISQLIDNDIIIQLYEEGCISEKTKAKYMLRSAGIPLNELKTNKPGVRIQELQQQSNMSTTQQKRQRSDDCDNDNDDDDTTKKAKYKT